MAGNMLYEIIVRWKVRKLILATFVIGFIVLGAIITIFSKEVAIVYYLATYFTVLIKTYGKPRL